MGWCIGLPRLRHTKNNNHKAASRLGHRIGTEKGRDTAPVLKDPGGDPEQRISRCRPLHGLSPDRRGSE